MSYFRERHTNKSKTQLELNYVTRSDLINAIGVVTLQYAKKDDLAKLKLVSTIFYQIFIFLPNDSSSKAMKNVLSFI